MKDFVSKHKKIIIAIGSLVIAALVICACFLFGGSKDKDHDDSNERSVYSITNNNSADKYSEVVDSDTKDEDLSETDPSGGSTKTTTKSKTESTKTTTTEKKTENITETTTEKRTEKQTTENKMESTTEKKTEKKTESKTEKTTEKKTTETTTESRTEKTTEKKTAESKTENTTEKTTDLIECNHMYNETVVEATCEKDGKRVCKCVICGDTYTEIIPSKGHEYDYENYVNATCTSDGKSIYKCLNCGKTKSEINEFDKATGHHYTCKTERDCEKGGTLVYKCDYCGDTYSETISAGSHSWDETWEEEDYHQGSYYTQIHIILDDGTDITALGWTIEDWTNHENEIGESHAWWSTSFYHWTSDDYNIIKTYHKCSKCGKTELVDTQTVYYHRTGDMTSSMY